MRKWLWLILLGGCAGGSAQYTESDNQKSVSTDLGNTFTVSLPAQVTAKPVFSQNVLTLSKDGIDGSQRRSLEFTATALGETDIRVGKEFLLHVRVLSASDRPGMLVPH